MQDSRDLRNLGMGPLVDEVAWELVLRRVRNGADMGWKGPGAW